MIKKIAEEKYNDTFWKEFGTNVKLGVIEDHSNRTRLAKLLRFQSSHHESNVTSLDQYVERMKEKQDKIYFMAGSSRKEVKMNCHCRNVFMVCHYLILLQWFLNSAETFFILSVAT